MELKTARTVISPLNLKDFDEILEMYHTPENNTFIPHLLNRDDEFYLSFLEGKIETNKKTMGFWTVREKESNTFIGTVNLNQYRETNINHIGAHITNTYWNQGFAFETLTELIRYGFDVRGLQNIFGIVSTDHTVSKKLLTKLGIEFFNEMEIDGTTVHLHKLSLAKVLLDGYAEEGF